MKRIVMILAIVCILIFTFTSCEGVVDDVLNLIPPNSADEVYERIDSKMNSLESYSASIDTDMRLYISGFEVDADISGSQILMSDYYYLNYNTVIKCDRLDLDQSIDSVVAYDDGKIYVSNVGSSYDQRIYSDITMEDFVKYLDYEFNSAVGGFEDAANKTYTANEDKSWTVKFWGYDDEAIERIVGSSFGDLFDADIYDLEIVINADSKYRATSAKVRVSFDVPIEEETPKLLINMEYSNYNCQEKAELDKSLYTKVDDVLILREYDKLLKKSYEYENARFQLDVKQTIKQNDSTETYEETDVVVYGEGEDGYFYDISYFSDGVSLNLSYSDKKLTISSGNEYQTQYQTDSQAKETINYLINSAKYEAARVRYVAKKEDGSYEITLDVDESLYDGVTGPYEIYRIDESINLKISNGKIGKIESTIMLVTIGGPSIIIESEVVFLKVS